MPTTAERLLEILRRRGLSIATAESLTGGMVGMTLTQVPGASQAYAGGVVTYTDRIKHAILGVPQELLERCSAVSREVAASMAEGCRSLMNVDMSLATTGVAGPASDDRGAPVGRVFIACCLRGSTTVRQLTLSGNREEIRAASTEAVLELGLRMLQDEP